MQIVTTEETIKSTIRDFIRHMTMAPKALRLLLATAIVAAKSEGWGTLK
jgi:hypothetical protein